MRRTPEGFGAPEALEFEEPIYTVSPGRNDEWHDTATGSATRRS